MIELLNAGAEASTRAAAFGAVREEPPVPALRDDMEIPEVAAVEASLPAGWAVARSQTTGRLYFYAPATGESTFDRRPLPGVAPSGVRAA